MKNPKAKVQIADVHPYAMTVKQLKEIVNAWPEEDHAGSDTLVWLQHEDMDKDRRPGMDCLCRVEFLALHHMMLTSLRTYASNCLVGTQKSNVTKP